MTYYINNLALATPIAPATPPITNVIDISHLRKAPHSNYTSQGKRKAAPCDPIRSLDDIARLKEYFLTQGEKGQRLRNYMIFVLGISVGLRGSDLLNIRIRDVLHPNGFIVDELYVHEGKTGKMNYPILNDTAKEAIVNYLNSLKNFDPEDFLIRSRGKASMDTNTLYHIMTKAQRDLNLPYHLGAHSLRKTFSYWTIAMHKDDAHILASLQEMLNHSDMRVTLRYSGQTKEHKRLLYHDIEKVLSGEATPVEDTEQSKLDTIIQLLHEQMNDDE